MGQQRCACRPPGLNNRFIASWNSRRPPGPFFTNCCFMHTSLFNFIENWLISGPREKFQKFYSYHPFKGDMISKVYIYIRVVNVSPLSQPPDPKEKVLVIQVVRGDRMIHCCIVRYELLTTSETFDDLTWTGINDEGQFLSFLYDGDKYKYDYIRHKVLERHLS